MAFSAALCLCIFGGTNSYCYSFFNKLFFTRSLDAFLSQMYILGIVLSCAIFASHFLNADHIFLD